MRLNEIKEVVSGEINLLEGVIPVHLTMTLEQVVRAGKITNNVQTFTIANLLSLMQGGGPYKWPREINSYPMNAGADMIEMVKGLPSEDVTKLATWLLEKLDALGQYEANPFAMMANPRLSPVEWVRWALRKQD